MSSPTAQSPKISQDDDDRASTIRQEALSETDADLTGDYTSQMRDFLSDMDESDESDEEFVYTGIHAQVSGSYRDRLHDVLGSSHDGSDAAEYGEEREVERSLLLEKDAANLLDETARNEGMSEYTPPPSSGASIPMTASHTECPAPGSRPVSTQISRPYLNPMVSRLRSYPAHASHLVGSPATDSPRHPEQSDRISRSRSASVISISENARKTGSQHSTSNGGLEREVFRWVRLHSITHMLYAPTKSSSKASAVLGSVLEGTAPSSGKPVVLAANGMVCIGTDTGLVYVFHFNQTLRCICGEETARTAGAVTAIALSHDHTFLATGHLSGHVQLFDLTRFRKPVRYVAPVTPAAVRSGRYQGHLLGSRILSVDFVGARHTAIVTSDDSGLAFYHSLGKMLFVEAPDVLRIFGKYPEGDEWDDLAVQAKRVRPPLHPRPHDGRVINTLAPRRHKSYAILAMMPLPLGTAPHPTDAYHVIALLTPSKLVVVGLKPTPRTWFKFRRERDAGDGRTSTSKLGSRRRGSLAWFPSVVPSLPGSQRSQDQRVERDVSQTAPMLIYSWESTLHLLRLTESKVKQLARHPRTGKATDVEVPTLVFETLGKRRLVGEGDGILALQWLNMNQVIVLTTSTLQLFDIQNLNIIEHVPFDSLSLASHTILNSPDAIGDINHSLRVYKGKLFLLGRQDAQVGTLLTWADRILTFVQNADFLSAIDVARSYYAGEAPGNTNGLPDDIEMRRDVIGQRLRDLMLASMRYAFSEERMTDGTHVTPDGRGVDRTSLFEGLVTHCARACIELDDMEFLFEDLHQQYEDHGIIRIFMTQLEPFVLEGRIPQVPARIAQRLVALHEEDGRPDLVERLIWHIDPTCLDIHQALRLCQRYRLYDALLYVYTRAMKDYVSPVVELLELVRQVHRFRKLRFANGHLETADEAALEPIILNAYKIFPYLTNTLSGLSYPGAKLLAEQEAIQAKKDLYAFLFSGRSSVWPTGEEGKLVLTSDEEDGIEPTFPYACTLLHFDAESFLHSLDIAFEDSFLNDETQGISRLVIVKTLLEILASQELPQATVTFVNIFIARNVPKYPQFIHIAPSALHNILVGLAEDPDPGTREDRQLAAEYLLSVYTPRESEHIIELFDTAGFFGILRSWHLHDKRWPSLLSTYMRDPDIRIPELFEEVSNVLERSARSNKGVLPNEVLVSMVHALPHLLVSSVTRTAAVLDKHSPELHSQALQALQVLGSDAEERKLRYLQHLLGPPRFEDDNWNTASRDEHPSRHVPEDLRLLYINLHCQIDPDHVVDALKFFPVEDLDWKAVLQVCEARGVLDAVIWGLNRKADLQGALSKTENFVKRATLEIVGLFNEPTATQVQSAIERAVKTLESMGRMAMDICLQHSQGTAITQVPLEDLWFQLLRSQIACVQGVAACAPVDGSDNGHSLLCSIHQNALSSLRTLLQASLASLVSISSTQAVSFPKLFKRLVDSAAHSYSSTRATYTEFRTILTGMLESYHAEGDMLIITKHLMDRDLFETVEIVTRARVRGWTSQATSCSGCRQTLVNVQQTNSGIEENEHNGRTQLIVSRNGAVYHKQCSPHPP